MSFIDALKKGFVWIGKELQKAAAWVPKLIVLVDDVEADAKTLLPEIGQVIDSAGEVVAAAVKDGAADINAAESLVNAIALAAAQKGINVAEDEGVLTAFKSFVAQVSTSSNYASLLTALKGLATNYDAMGVSVKAALAKLEQDAG